MSGQAWALREWTVPAVVPRLAADEVHVWLLPLDLAETAVASGLAGLSADERARADRLRVPAARARFVAARARLRQVLARYLGCAPHDVLFITAERGKPALAGASGGGEIRFNLSHSHDLALCAVAARWEVGVDVECIRPGPWEAGVAERFFSATETAGLRALPAAVQRDAFFAVWTRKEACLKAWGRGLTLPLSGFEVPVRLDGLTAMVSTVAGDCQLWELPAIPGHAAALAVAGCVTRLACWREAGGIHWEAGVNPGRPQP